MLKALIKTMRPRQWIKNGFVFFALIFDRQLFNLEPFLRTLAGFFLFCLISSAVYLFNDIADVEADRNHPVKEISPDRLRPAADRRRLGCRIVTRDRSPFHWRICFPLDFL